MEQGPNKYIAVLRAKFESCYFICCASKLLKCFQNNIASVKKYLIKNNKCP